MKANIQTSKGQYTYEEVHFTIGEKLINWEISKSNLLVFSGTIFGILSSIIGYPFLATFGYPKQANNSLIHSSIIYGGLYFDRGICNKKYLLRCFSPSSLYN